MKTLLNTLATIALLCAFVTVATLTGANIVEKAYADCNDPAVIIVPGKYIQLTLSPCGPTVPPDFFDVRFNGSFPAAIPAEASGGNVTIQLWTRHLLEPGLNEIRYRARVNDPRYKAGNWDKVTLEYIPTPPTATPTETPLPQPTPTPTLIDPGDWTVTGVKSDETPF